MPATFPQLCQRITFTARRPFFTRVLAWLPFIKPVQYPLYRMTLQYQGRSLRQTMQFDDRNERPTCQQVLAHWLHVVETANPDNGMDFNWWLIQHDLQQGPLDEDTRKLYRETLEGLAKLKTLLGVDYPTFVAALPSAN